MYSEREEFDRLREALKARMEDLDLPRISAADRSIGVDALPKDLNALCTNKIEDTEPDVKLYRVYRPIGGGDEEHTIYSGPERQKARRAWHAHPGRHLQIIKDAGTDDFSDDPITEVPRT